LFSRFVLTPCLTLFQVGKYVLLGDAAAAAGAGELTDVDPFLRGQSPGRRGQDDFGRRGRRFLASARLSLRGRGRLRLLILPAVRLPPRRRRGGGRGGFDLPYHGADGHLLPFPDGDAERARSRGRDLCGRLVGLQLQQRFAFPDDITVVL